MDTNCPKCGSGKVEVTRYFIGYLYYCLRCRKRWNQLEMEASRNSPGPAPTHGDGSKSDPAPIVNLNQEKDNEKDDERYDG